MDQRGDHMKMNFEYFQIQIWILKTVRSEKLDEENGVICPVSTFPSWVMVLKLSKKVLFVQFRPDSIKKCSLQQFTYMHLKGVIMHFQKIVLFVVLWLNISQILKFKFEGFCYISAE